MLRALRKDGGLELTFPSGEEKTSGASPFYSHYAHVQRRNAMLEADREKGEAIDLLRRKILC
jgi:hypothetical protein